MERYNYLRCTSLAEKNGPRRIQGQGRTKEAPGHERTKKTKEHRKTRRQQGQGHQVPIRSLVHPELGCPRYIHTRARVTCGCQAHMRVHMQKGVQCRSSSRAGALHGQELLHSTTSRPVHPMRPLNAKKKTETNLWVYKDGS